MLCLKVYSDQLIYSVTVVIVKYLLISKYFHIIYTAYCSLLLIVSLGSHEKVLCILLFVCRLHCKKPSVLEFSKKITLQVIASYSCFAFGVYY